MPFIGGAFMPKISVIIPAYNAEAFIDDALHSVFRQTEKNFEVIVVDDGSGDGTANIIRKFSGVQYVRQPNMGVSAARNNGVRLATGEYLAFLDADDVWHPRKLEWQLRAFRQHPDSVLCHTRATRDPEQIQGEEDVGASIGMRCVVHADMTATFLAPYLGPSTVMVRRDTFIRVSGFDERLRIAEDVDFYLRVLAEAPRALTLEAPLVYMRPVQGSLSSDHTAGYIALLDVYRRFLRDHPEAASAVGRVAVRKAFYDLHLRLARSLLWTGNSKRARRQALEALRQRVGGGAITVALRTLLPLTTLRKVRRLRRS